MAWELPGSGSNGDSFDAGRISLSDSVLWNPFPYDTAIRALVRSTDVDVPAI